MESTTLGGGDIPVVGFILGVFTCVKRMNSIRNDDYPNPTLS